MQNLIFSILLTLSISSQPNLNSCNDYFDNHLVRSDIMMQIVLKSYGYYDGKIDGDFGSGSKKALVLFQGANNLSPDGVLGQKTCKLLLNKKNIVSNNQKDDEIVNVEDSYSQDIYDAQVKLKNLGLYTSTVDGINGPGTKRAIKQFQEKAGLNIDGVVGPLTLAALEKGEKSYIKVDNVNTTASTNTTEVNSSNSALDLRNYDPNKQCVNGYVDANGIWIPDPCFKPVFVYRFGKICTHWELGGTNIGF